MSFSQFGDSPGVINLDDKAAVLSGFPRLLFQGHYGRCEKMKNDLFPSLDFTCLQNWPRKLVGKFHDAGIHQITLRIYRETVALFRSSIPNRSRMEALVR